MGTALSFSLRTFSYIRQRLFRFPSPKKVDPGRNKATLRLSRDFPISSMDAAPGKREQIWQFDFRRSARAMAQALGLGRLQNYIQGTRTELLPTSPVCILGVEHKPSTEHSDGNYEQSHRKALEDLSSRVWFTYRYDFAPIGSNALTSDVGWGCTLRSGQMLLAEGLLRHTLGRSWRRGGGDAACGERAAADVAQLLLLMHDTPEPWAPFSLHNLCAAPGVSGVQAGEWLGPWVLCHALQAAVRRARPFGVALHVLAEPGGGAPTLYLPTLLNKFFPLSASESAASGGSLLTPAHAAAEGELASISGDGSRPGTEAASLGVAEVDDAADASKRADSVPASALMLLLPLTLGIDKVNPRYISQLQTILTWPQSIGIIGGRPGSSLTFIGCQEEHVLFLDPHTAQQVVPAAEVGNDATYHCKDVRAMPLASIDPSLAIGFYCRTADSLQELCSQLRELEVRSAGAPLVAIGDGPAPPKSRWLHTSASDSSSQADQGGDWELL